MKKFMKLKNKKGFTLVELIVVIVILGILAGIAVPAMSGFKKDATETAAEQSARTAYSALSAAGAKMDAVAIGKIATDGTASLIKQADLATGKTGDEQAFLEKCATLLGDNFTGAVAIELSDDKTISKLAWAASVTNNKPDGDMVIYTPSAKPGKQFEHVAKATATD